jgi:hypothetical protein
VLGEVNSKAAVKVKKEGSNMHNPEGLIHAC